ncbi:hypothetical protein D9M73_90480 [compost metagenome]
MQVVRQTSKARVWNPDPQASAFVRISHKCNIGLTICSRLGGHSVIHEPHRAAPLANRPSGPTKPVVFALANRARQHPRSVAPDRLGVAGHAGLACARLDRDDAGDQPRGPHADHGPSLSDRRVATRQCRLCHGLADGAQGAQRQSVGFGRSGDDRGQSRRDRFELGRLRPSQPRCAPRGGSGAGRVGAA